MLMSITDIIVESYRLYKNNVKKFFPYILLTFIPSALIVIARFILTYFAPGASLGTIGLSFLSFLLVALLLSAVGFWFSIAFIRVIANAYTGKTSGSIGSELGTAKKIFWPAVGVTILTALAVLGGMILLIIPGIIFMLWFAFSYASVTIDNTGVMESLHKSKALVDGRWWNVFWRLVIPGLALGILVYVIIDIVSFPTDYVLKHTNPSSSLYSIWLVVGEIIISFFTALLTPLTTIAMVILYFELKKTPHTAPTPQMTSPESLS